MEFSSGWISPQSKKLSCCPDRAQTKVLERIILLQPSLEQFIFSAPGEAVRAAERLARRKTPIPGPTEFAISLKAYVDKIAATCPLGGHKEVQRDGEEGENT
jgi:hypothetical protein